MPAPLGYTAASLRHCFQTTLRNRHFWLKVWQKGSDRVLVAISESFCYNYAADFIATAAGILSMSMFVRT